MSRVALLHLTKKCLELFLPVRQLLPACVTAVDAAAAGKGRYGMILWVKPKNYARAARALGAR